MLYPTYLSSYRNLLKKDITPISLMNVFMGDRSKKPNVSKQEPSKQHQNCQQLHIVMFQALSQYQIDRQRQ